MHAIKPGFCFAALLLITVGVASASAATTGSGSVLANLKQLSFEELMTVQVTSVTGVEEVYHDAAAALTVVTDEHLRRTGARNIPEALRLVPGLHVARRNANSWAISSRGFSSVNSEKLLVLSDTRSIYTPLVSGVLWDVQDYFMADIQRIEVIRGPGATLWGSNAVNGVINITTKHAADTHGTHVESSVGTDERVMFGARYGAETSGGVHYRVFGKYFELDESVHRSGRSDDAQFGHLGFRADWKPRSQDEFTVQGDLYRGAIGQLAPAISVQDRREPTGPLETDVAGGNILARWRHWFAADSDLQLRAYYDRTHRDDPSFTDDLDTIDLDVRHRFTPWTRHTAIWGVNYRYTSNRNEGRGVFALRPVSSEDQLISGFVQDQVTLRDGLRVTVGTKLEHNDFSGFEVQPSIRGAWDFAIRQTLWAAVSRAARIPTRLERDVFIDVSDPAANPVTRLLGNRDFGAEELVAYELGYRWRAADNVNLEVALFENRYEGLASLELGAFQVEPGTGRTVVPILYRNLTDGRARGIETVVTFSPTSQWRLSASHAYLNLDLEPRGLDLNRGRFYEGATPRHQYALSSYWTLPAGFELDAHFRRIGQIRQSPESPLDGYIPGYNELDLSLSWQFSFRTRFSIVGRNLLHKDHLEFGSPAARGPIARAVQTKVVWDF